MISESELNKSVYLCDKQGNLKSESIGWSRQPLHTCNLSGHWPRKKRWNYWCVTTPDCLFSITLSNIDYMGLAFAYFLNFKTGQFIEQTVMAPLGRGFDLPETINGNINFSHKDIVVAFQDTPSTVVIHVTSPAFGDLPLAANLVIRRPPAHDTLNVVIPWSTNRFQFTSKQNCLPVEGSVSVGKDRYEIKAGQSFACLDFGRGIWPYRCFWNWASFSGKSSTHTIGVNLGAGWTDGTGMTENGILVDGHLIKLSEDIIFSYDPAHFMQPWALKTCETNRVDLKLIPFYERVARTDVLVVKSEVHQMIGRFSGVLRPDGAAEIRVDSLVGWAEEHHARW